MSAALATPVEETRTALQHEPAVGKAEAGWRQMKEWVCLWVTAVSPLALFTIACRRTREVVKAIPGENFGGMVCYDYCSANANAPGWGARAKAAEILKVEVHPWTFLTDAMDARARGQDGSSAAACQVSGLNKLISRTGGRP